MDSTSIQFRSHTALLLAAALPYLQPIYQRPVELALKFLELSETMKAYPKIPFADYIPQGSLHKSSLLSPEDSGIFALISRFIQDPEGLLHNLSNVCTGKEQEIIRMLLNLMQVKNMYENYGDIFSSFLSPDSFPDFSGFQTPPVPDTPSQKECSTPDMASVLSGGDFSSMLSKEQSDTLNLLKNLLDAE